MFNNKILSLLLVVVVSVTITQGAFANNTENDRLGVDIQYNEGDTIVVSGQLDDVQSDKSLWLHFKNSLNHIVSSSANIPISDDGSYSSTMLTGGSTWEYSGTYTVNVFYGNELLSSVEFIYYPNDGVSPDSEYTLAEHQINELEKEIKKLEKENKNLNDRVIFQNLIINSLQEKKSCGSPLWD